MAERTYRTEAVVLRSLRLGEADRVLHLYTLDRGRIGAVAKGIRQDEVTLRRPARAALARRADAAPGRGELQTVTGAQLMRSHHASREERLPAERRARRRRGDAPPVRRAGGERARVRGADAVPRPARRAAGARPTRPALDPLALSFQLKLLWLSGYLPHLTSCANCGRADELVGYSPHAGGAVCRTCGEGAIALSPAGLRRDRAAAQRAARRRGGRRAHRARRARGARGDHRVVRVPRRLPPPDATQRLAARPDTSRRLG